MKKIIFALLLLTPLVAVLSCRTSRKTPSGMVEDVIPMSGSKYRSDAEYFRAVQSGVSTERSTAQKIALQNCRQELAASIRPLVQSVVEDYVHGQALEAETGQLYQYQELSYTVVDQQLADVRTVEGRIYRQDDGTFRYYVCLQMSKSALENALSSTFAGDAKLRLEFNREQFKKIFDARMSRPIQAGQSM